MAADAHVEAPTAGFRALAGVLLKMGTYGSPFKRPASSRASPAQRPLDHGSGAHRHCLWCARGAGATERQEAHRLFVSKPSRRRGFWGFSSLTQSGMDGAMFVNLAHGVSNGRAVHARGNSHERRHTYEIKRIRRPSNAHAAYARCFSL